MSNTDDEETIMHPNVSAYQKVNPKLRAECAYFYYFDERPEAKSERRVFFIDCKKYIPFDDMQNQILKMLEEIDEGTHKPDPLDLNSQIWTRKSYFILVMRAKPGGGLSRCDAVRFSNDLSKGNHAFKDGYDTLPFPEPYDDVTGFYCLNHMKSQKTGGDLKDGEAERFFFSLSHGLGHEGSGTNQGPPLGPP